MRREIIKIREPETAPEKESIALSIILTSLLVSTFSIMAASTYNFSVSRMDLFLSSVILSIGATYVNSRKNKLWPMLLLIGTPIISFLLVFFNALHLKEALWHFVTMLERYTFRVFLNKHNYQITQEGVHSISYLFALYNHFAICITTFVLVRKKPAFFGILTIVPYIILTATVTYNPPSMMLCIVALSAIILMIIKNRIRHASRKDGERLILIISVPLLILILTVGIVFPQKKYRMNRLAVQTIHQVRGLVAKHVDPLSDKSKLITKILNEAEFGKGKKTANYSSPIMFMENGSIERCDLSAVGNYYVREYSVGKVIIHPNREYSDSMIAAPKFLYIRSSTMDIYEDNLWQVSDTFTGEYVDREKIDNYVPELSPYYVEFVDAPNDIVPYYTDLYVTDYGHMPAHEIINVELSTEDDGGNPLSDLTPQFPLNTVPVKRGELFTEEYLNDYVYTTCLEVPENTRNDLISSGLLPDWYIEVLKGTSDLTQDQIVMKVTDYVSTLHPYEEATPFPPEDADFVTWFVCDSETGFCVHYASTAVILLRMANIPARYVTGYVTKTEELDWESTLYSTDAHAWFEFYSDDFGWVMGDPTPGNGFAAAIYDINAIQKAYYDIDVKFENYKTNKENNLYGDYDDPVEVEYVPKDVRNVMFILKVIAYVLIGLVLALCVFFILFRIVYIIFWMNRFRNKDISLRSIYYYRYFSRVCKAYKGILNEEVINIAKKARFSENGLNEEELNELIELGKKSCADNRKSLPGHKRITGDILTINII